LPRKKKKKPEDPNIVEADVEPVSDDEVAIFPGILAEIPEREEEPLGVVEAVQIMENLSESVNPVQELKDQLKIWFDERPRYNGRQYNEYHKWCSRGEALIQ